MNMSREEQLKYDYALKVYRDNLMFEQEYKDGLKKALEEGMEKGREEGRLEVAKEMIKNGMSLDLVAKFSGLPLETLKDLNV